MGATRADVPCAAGSTLPLPRYSGGEGRGEGRGARGDEMRLHPQAARRVRAHRLHAHPSPLPCPLPGVPGRGSEPSSEFRASAYHFAVGAGVGAAGAAGAAGAGAAAGAAGTAGAAAGGVAATASILIVCFTGVTDAAA